MRSMHRKFNARILGLGFFALCAIQKYVCNVPTMLLFHKFVFDTMMLVRPSVRISIIQLLNVCMGLEGYKIFFS